MPQPPDGEKERIIILDDERSILDILGQHLMDDRYEVVLSDSPHEVLQALERGRFSLLITDLKMPDMHGIEVLERAKRIDEDLAVIVVTALMDIQNAIDAMRAGAYDYLLKPFNLAEITFSVEKALKSRRLVIENRRYQQELEDRVQQATRELKATKEYLENLLHSSVDAIVTIDKQGVINYINQGTTKTLGFNDADALGRPFEQFLAGGRDEADYIRRMLETAHEIQSYETELRTKDGRSLPVSMSIAAIKHIDGSWDNYVVICKDITAQKNVEASLKEESIKDGLTGLYNQRYFFDRLESEIERARRQGHALSLLLFDVDQFKTYNDRHGHLEGDKVLRAVGQVVMECTREHVDISFRYGGDEFTVILPEAREEQAMLIAERIRSTFEEKHFDTLTLSIGLMTYKAGQTARSFIHFVDKIMYSAKRSGGNRVYIHRGGDEDITVESAQENNA